MITKREGKSEKNLAVLEDTRNLCGALTNDGNKCLHVKGFNTDHVGEGRCYQHENFVNGTQITAYEIPAIKERMEEFLYDKDMYTLDREIAMLRAYLELYKQHLAVFKDLTASELQVLGITFTPSDLNSAINTTTKTIATLIKTKSEIEIARKFVIPLNVVQMMFGKVAEIIDHEIEDVELKNRIGNRLGNIMLNG